MTRQSDIIRISAAELAEMGRLLARESGPAALRLLHAVTLARVSGRAVIVRDEEIRTRADS